MIKWSKVAEEIAHASYDDQRLSEPYLELQGLFIFNFSQQNHYPHNNNPPRTYKVIYNYIVTLGERKGLDEQEKVDKLFLYVDRLFLSRKFALNVLSSNGYEQATAPNETQVTSFSSRKFHPEIVSHCKTLFEQGHYFLAMSEACKAYNIAVKKKLGGTTKDGRDLMLSEFGQDKRIRAVPGDTESEKNFLEGIKFLSAGLIVGFRNPTSHETVQTWMIDEQDCLDILSLASYLFRQLDKSVI